MKVFLIALALVAISSSAIYAGVNEPPTGRVPEPSSLLLLGSGIGGLVMWLRKRS